MPEKRGQDEHGHDDVGQDGRGAAADTAATDDLVARRRVRTRALLVAAIVLILAVLVVAQLRAGDPSDETGAPETAEDASETDDGADDEPDEDPEGDPSATAGTGEPDETGAGDGPSPGPLPEAPGPAPAPDPDDPDASADAALATLVHYLELADLAYSAPDTPVDLEGTATGPAADEVDATATEFAASGYRQRGAVQVEEVEVEQAALGDDPPSLTLLACLDATRITLIDADGEVVRPPTPDSRSLHRYDLVHRDGTWQVIRHGLPDDAAC